MYMNKPSIPLGAIAAAALMWSLAGAATAQGAAPSAMSGASAAMGRASVAAPDRGFVMNAAKGGMGEVALGQLAQQKASGDAVKQFASHMVDDHGKANDELKQLADSKGIMLPAAPPADPKAQRLQTLSGAAFDRAYMTMMVADHKKTIALFQKGAQARDADIKAFATKTLPTLKSHLQMAQQTLATTTASGAAASSKG
jgi:putative membrane protein